MFIKYDSTHGTIKGSVKVVDESTLEINGKSILQLPAKGIPLYKFIVAIVFVI